MSLLSCANCWYNPLQYDLIGDEVGYCVEHRKVLRRPDESTCGRLLRKDLGWSRSLAVNQRHRQEFSDAEVVPLRAATRRRLPVLAEDDAGPLNGDVVREHVVEYGLLGAKIESLARLETVHDPRGEVAFLSLSRGYVNRCVQRDGRWTSGLHLLWWLRRRLMVLPEVDVRHLRRVALREHSEERLSHLLALATWSVTILRLTLLDDIAGHEARDTPPGKRILEPLRDVLEAAAAATRDPSPQRLQSWIVRTAVPAFDKALPRQRYQELASQLHREPSSPSP